MCVAEYMIPRVILRLIQHLRINSIPSNAQMDKEAQWSQCEQVILRADPFLKLLHDFSSLGSAMRTVMTKCLIDPMTYQRYIPRCKQTYLFTFFSLQFFLKNVKIILQTNQCGR